MRILQISPAPGGYFVDGSGTDHPFLPVVCWALVEVDGKTMIVPAFKGMDGRIIVDPATRLGVPPEGPVQRR